MTSPCTRGRCVIDTVNRQALSQWLCGHAGRSSGNGVIMAVLLSVMVVGLAGFPFASARGAEVVESFHTDLTVDSDGVLQVTESISVQVEGREFKRGIYRRYKQSFTDLFGVPHSVAYSVVEVTRNGRPEPWHIKNIDNDLAVYVGESDVLLSPGLHDYRIRYTTDYQLGFGDDVDDLYWDVTGNAWSVPIEVASVSITMPGGVSDVEFTGFTGPPGSTVRDIQARQNSGRVEARTTRVLSPGEGLTVHARWPRGVIVRPEGRTEYRSTSWLGNGGPVATIRALFENGIALLGLIGVALVWVWSQFGRVAGEKPRRALRQVSPPRGLGPAALRWLDQGSCDHGVLVCALMSLASKGRLHIYGTPDDSADPVFFHRAPDAQGAEKPLTRSESYVFKRLFRDSSSVALRRNEQHLWRTLRHGIEHVLDEEFREQFFVTNTGLVFKVAGAVIVAMFVWLITRSGDSGFSPIPIFLGGLAMVFLFSFCVDDRTADGQKIKHEIDAFRDYLKTDPALGDDRRAALWPYAIALDVMDRFTAPANASAHGYRGKDATSMLSAAALIELTNVVDRDLARYSRSPDQSSGHTEGGSFSSGSGGGSSGGGGGGSGGGGW